MYEIIKIVLNESFKFKYLIIYYYNNFWKVLLNALI